MGHSSAFYYSTFAGVTYQSPRTSHATVVTGALFTLPIFVDLCIFHMHMHMHIIYICIYICIYIFSVLYDANGL